MMPIYNDGFDYENRATGFEGFNVLGTIRKGEPKAENRAGKNLPYFRFDLKPEYEHLAPALVELYGEQPTELNNVILVGGKTLNQIFPHWLMEFSGNGVLTNKCDGRTNVLSLDKSTGEYDASDKPCLKFGVGCGCQPSAMLRFNLPELSAATNTIGVFLVPVTSGIEIARFRAFLHGLETRLNQMGGDLNQIVLDFDGKQRSFPILYRFSKVTEKVAIPAPGKGRSKVNQFLCALDVMPDVIRVLSQYTPVQLEGGTPVAVLPHQTESTPVDIPVKRLEQWDIENLQYITSHLFDNIAHQNNAINAAIRLGVLLPGNDNETATRRFVRWRDYRKDREGKPGKWNDNVETVTGMVQVAASQYGMSMTEVMKALETDVDHELGGIPDYPGSKAEAYAAIIAYGVDYDPGKLGKLYLDGKIGDHAYEVALAIIGRKV